MEPAKRWLLLFPIFRFMKQRYSLVLHCALWLSLPFVFVFFKWVYQFTTFPPAKADRVVSYLQFFQNNYSLNTSLTIIGASTFYLTYLVVLPAILTRPRKIARAIVSIALLLLLPFLITVVLSQFSFAVALFFRYFLFFSYLVQLFFILLAVASGYLNRWLRATRDIALLEKHALKTELELLKSQINPHFLFNTINNIDTLILEKHALKTELELLKSQINPHFLFNTINNIDTLILQNPEQASQYLNELADLLRFMLYEVKDEEIDLLKEITYIEKYIRLQKIRSVNPNFISLQVNGDFENQKIAPLLFIPLIENAFKHVPDKTANDGIQINFEISPDSLRFNCRNKFISDDRRPKNEGIGLNIIAQRLKLLYENRHQIEVKKDDSYYEVTLKLKLNAN